MDDMKTVERLGLGRLGLNAGDELRRFRTQRRAFSLSVLWITPPWSGPLRRLSDATLAKTLQGAAEQVQEW